MPGTHFTSSISRINPDFLKRAGEELLLKRNYEHSILYATSQVSLSFSGYDGYPCLYHEERDYIFLVEGLIYNISDREIISRLKTSYEAEQIGSSIKSEITDFIEKADGDYFVVIYDKKRNRTIMFNDRWGRLSVYYYADNNIFIISREIKYILNLIPSIAIDKIGIAEFLTLEYNLGDKTIFKGIKTLKPSSMIVLSNSGGQIETEISQIIPINFDRVKNRLLRRDAVRNSCELFYKAVKSRVEKVDELESYLTADLSGGFDSRAVVGALCHTGIEFAACTDDIITGNEFDYAEQISDNLRLVLNSYVAEHPVDGFEELSSVTYITDGTINAYINTACFYDDLERQKDLPPRRMNFMGLGGEFMRNVYKKRTFYKNITSMLNDDCYSHALTIDEAIGLLGLDRSLLVEDFNTAFELLEERTFDGQARRLFFEYYRKAVNAGENRHRIFNWTISPFWSNNLIGFNMQMVPQMIDYDFYLKFLALLDKNLLKVPFAPYSYSLNNSLMRMMFKIGKRFRNMVRDNRLLNKTAGLLRGKKRDMDREDYQYLIDELVSISEKSLLIKSVFEIDEIKIFTAANENLYNYYQLLTVVLYLHEIERRFPDRILI